MGGTLLPWVTRQFFTNVGVPAAGYKVFSYAAGTSNKLSTFSDEPLTVPNANPTILDAAGRGTFFLTPGLSYKIVFTDPTDSDPPVSPIWTLDGVAAVPSSVGVTDVLGTAGENLLVNEVVYLSDGSAGTTAGRWYRTDSDNHYSAAGAGATGFAVTDAITGGQVTIRTSGVVDGASGLTPGAVYYASTSPGIIVSTPPTQGQSYRNVAVALTTSSWLLAEKARAQGRDRVATMLVEQGNVGAGEDTLFEYIAPAGELALDGMSYHGKFWGLTANNANAKTLSVRVIEGANNTVTIAFVLTASELGEFVLDFDIMRTTATTYAHTTGARCGPANGPTSRVGDNNDATLTTTWANAVTIRVTGTATSNNDIRLLAGNIRLLD